MAAGFGDSPKSVGEKLTWRQMQHFSSVLRRQQRHQQADMIQGVAMALGAKDLPGLLQKMRE